MKPLTEVRDVKGKGRGVFAVRNIKKNSIIEDCHLIFADVPEGESNTFLGYTFRVSKRKIALALGNGSLYNHSYEPNAYHFYDSKSKTMCIFADRDIRCGEEITINYMGETGEKVWFKVK